ncbi:acyl-CoA thioesterase [Spongiibacter sp. KMU-158]|uniref:Acyl-CoA thioesterase n=1 Tax=Spongiibacter pelagi TaxID=2760804 RepID=A0A927GUW9_9GAMM|nr:thioesterase family protein [Spongiibacter pelagi]MBD2858046.1 acyl-CoA thioesterase [Spongiibacter pelagi]
MKVDAPFDYPNPFLRDIEIQAEHIDGLGHVNNAVYVSWCQEAGWAHSVALDLDLASYKQLDAAMAIRHAEYDYTQAAYLGQRCKLATWLTGNDNRLSMERRFQLVHEDGHTLFRAKWQLICIRMSNGKPRRMPPEFIEQYGAAVITIESEQ